MQIELLAGLGLGRNSSDIGTNGHQAIYDSNAATS